MAIEIKELNAFTWEHFKRFVASNPANADFPETHIEQKDGVLTILHDGVEDESHSYTYHLPLDQGMLHVRFKIGAEWDAVVCAWIDSAGMGLLQDYSEHINRFIAGVSHAIEFTDDELAKIDAARELSGQTREEFIYSAITTACEEEWERVSGDKSDKCGELFTRKLKEQLGDESTVRLLWRSDDVDAFVVGLEGCEAHVNELSDMVVRHDCGGASDEIIEFCETNGGKDNPRFVLYYNLRESSPFSNEKVHADWVGGITATFRTE